MLIRVKHIYYFSFYFLLFFSIYKTVNAEEIITTSTSGNETIQTNLLKKNFQPLSFNRIKELDKLKSLYSLGKNDPFYKDNKIGNQKELKSIKLIGLISNGQKSFALINYSNNIGSVSIGEIGGKTTNLLPNDIKLINILIDKLEITVELKGEKYKISI